jgi:hypothetical protein
MKLIVIQLINKLLISLIVMSSHSYPYRITYMKSATTHAAHLRYIIFVLSIYSRIPSSYFLRARKSKYSCISIFSDIGQMSLLALFS